MSASGKRYLLGDYSLEPDKHLLARGGLTVRLPKKPFQVLLYLIEHRDRLVSRAELLERFWDGQDVYEDALRKSVAAIRKVLDDQSEDPRFVETRWGVGYRYIGPLEEQLVSGELSVVEVEKTRGVRVVVEEVEMIDNTVSTEVPGTVALVQMPRLHALARGMRFAVLALVLAAVATGAFVRSSYRAHPGPTVARGAPIRSVAVLSLRNLTGDPSDDYLSDGLTESLIAALTNVEGLKIISRGSVFTMKGRDIDPGEAGRLLGVGAVVEGSVRKSGDRVRVEVRLVSTLDGEVLWAGEAYDRPAADIFTIQDEVSRNVVTGLRLKVAGEDGRRPSAHYTDNTEAYEAYLKGRFCLNKRTPEDIEKAINYFRRAVEVDPTYAPAFAGLAKAYDKEYWFSPRLMPGGLTESARDAASKALALDGSLAEAHLAMAAVYADSLDFPHAVAAASRAVAISPGDADARHDYAYRLIQFGRADEAVAEIRRARDLDPLNVVMNVDVGEILLYAGRDDEAVEALKHAIEMDESRFNAHYDLALAYERKGMANEALEEYLKNETLRGADAGAVAELRKAFATSGLSGFWRKKLEMARAKATRGAPVFMASLHARLGEKERAFDLLEKAYASRSPVLAGIKVDPMFEGLRSDPRYEDLVRRIGLERLTQPF